MLPAVAIATSMAHSYRGLGRAGAWAGGAGVGLRGQGLRGDRGCGGGRVCGGKGGCRVRGVCGEKGMRGAGGVRGAGVRGGRAGRGVCGGRVMRAGRECARVAAAGRRVTVGGAGGRWCRAGAVGAGAGGQPTLVRICLFPFKDDGNGKADENKVSEDMVSWLEVWQSSTPYGRARAPPNDRGFWRWILAATPTRASRDRGPCIQRRYGARALAVSNPEEGTPPRR